MNKLQKADEEYYLTCGYLLKLASKYGIKSWNQKLESKAGIKSWNQKLAN